MEIRYVPRSTDLPIPVMAAEVYEGAQLLSRIKTVATRPTRYHSQWISTMTVGGVATDPEYRRGGYVRMMLEDLFRLSADRDWVVSLLHPFSFAYYRKFGYEKVADHLILEFPLEKLEHFPRVNDFVKVNGAEYIPDAVKVFEKFSIGRNLSFRRFGGEHLPTEPDFNKRVCYIRYRGAEPVAYIVFNLDREIVINRMHGKVINVYEFAFTDPEALRDIFGFLRMFDGEMERVKFHNCAMTPEVDVMLRHYMHVSYTVVPDLMARVLNTEKLLLANDFPLGEGHFVLGVEDALPAVTGVFQVEYAKGKANVKRLSREVASFTGKTDVVCESGALSQILYGYHSLTPDLLPYINGVKVTGDPTDLIRAYPKAKNGLFEHF